MSAVIFQTQSALILALLIFGVTKVAGKVKNRYQHMKIMKVAIIWDVLLILQIELTRGAIAKASKAMENKAILNIHVLLALTAVLLYIYLYFSGKKVDSGDSSPRQKHKILGYVALAARTAVLITSFLVL